MNNLKFSILLAFASIADLWAISYWASFSFHKWHSYWFGFPAAATGAIIIVLASVGAAAMYVGALERANQR